MYEQKPMDPRVKGLWVRELRSGNYEQGRQFLRTVEGRYCCLGILCEIAVKEGVIPEPELRSFQYSYAGDHQSGLPPKILSWSGVNDGLGRFRTKKSVQSLSTLNDNGTTFSEIADIIEKEF